MSSIVLGSSKNHQIKEIFEMYFLILNFDNENYKIEASTFNSNYFHTGKSLINTYGMLLTDFKEFVNNKKEKVRFIDFLKFSVENSMLADKIEYIDFIVQDEHIFIERNGEQEDWINMGEFYIDNYQINACGSYLFFTDLRSNEQYMYYGD